MLIHYDAVVAFDDFDDNESGFTLKIPQVTFWSSDVPHGITIIRLEAMGNGHPCQQHTDKTSTEQAR